MALPEFPWLGSFSEASKAQRGGAERAIAGKNEPNHGNSGRAKGIVVFFFYFFIVSVFLCLSSCGQSGKLYLPKHTNTKNTG